MTACPATPRRPSSDVGVLPVEAVPTPHHELTAVPTGTSEPTRGPSPEDSRDSGANGNPAAAVIVVPMGAAGGVTVGWTGYDRVRYSDEPLWRGFAAVPYGEYAAAGVDAVLRRAVGRALGRGPTLNGLSCGYWLPVCRDVAFPAEADVGRFEETARERLADECDWRRLPEREDGWAPGMDSYPESARLSSSMERSGGASSAFRSGENVGRFEAEGFGGGVPGS